MDNMMRKLMTKARKIVVGARFNPETCSDSIIGDAILLVTRKHTSYVPVTKEEWATAISACRNAKGDSE